MSDLVVLQNDMSQEGMRRVHVMAPMDLSDRAQHVAPLPVIPVWAEVKTWEDEIRLHHLSAMWLAREAMYYDFRRYGEKRVRPVVVWALNPPAATAASPRMQVQHSGGQIRISEAAVDAALVFCGTFGYWPSAAWVRTWPQGLKEEDATIPVSEDCGMDLFAVRWVPDGFVVVGGGLYG